MSTGNFNDFSSDVLSRTRVLIEVVRGSWIDCECSRTEDSEPWRMRADFKLVQDDISLAGE